MRTEPAHLFSANALGSGAEFSIIHPVHNRTIRLWRGGEDTVIAVSGGDLGDFICEVVVDNEDINWVADALGRAPAPM